MTVWCSTGIRIRITSSLPLQGIGKSFVRRRRTVLLMNERKRDR